MKPPNVGQIIVQMWMDFVHSGAKMLELKSMTPRAVSQVYCSMGWAPNAFSIKGGWVLVRGAGFTHAINYQLLKDGMAHLLTNPPSIRLHSSSWKTQTEQSTLRMDFLLNWDFGLPDYFQSEVNMDGEKKITVTEGERK